MIYFLLKNTGSSLAPDRNWSKLLFYLPALFWCLTILYFSLLPSDLVPDRLSKMDDKFIHSGIYFVCAMLLFLPFSKFISGFTAGKFTLLIILLASIFYGGVLELVQEYAVPGRTGDWLDFIANIAGALIAVLIIRLFSRRSS